MAKFKFQLASVEKVRVQKEQKMLEELAHSQRNYQEKLGAKNELLAKKQTSFSSKNDLSHQGSSINQIRVIEDYISGIKLKIIRADQAIIRSRRFLDQAMKNYIDARRARKMIDRLKEKAIEEFKINESRSAQKNLDDLISMRTRLNESPFDSDEELS